MSSPYPQSYPQQSYPPPPQQMPPQSSGSGCWIGALIGCLGAIVLSVVLCGVGAWWVKNNVTNLIATVAREAIVSVIKESELEQQEKTEVIAQIDRVVDAVKSGKLKPEELEKLFNEMQDSPIFVLIQIYGVEKVYLEPSGLSAEEKQAGKRVFERAFRGIHEKKIAHSDFEAAMPESMRHQGDDPEMKRPQQVSDEDVKKLIANLKKLADDAQIPDEAFQIDISDELKKDIDKVLAGKE
ncbi:MAG TPA: hypothetical protein VFB80_23225 [Pirellulaceae bacterium]|nr:hypothetical protein [Pirellulaceae bacterium]